MRLPVENVVGWTDQFHIIVFEVPFSLLAETDIVFNPVELGVNVRFTRPLMDVFDWDFAPVQVTFAI